MAEKKKRPPAVKQGATTPKGGRPRLEFNAETVEMFGKAAATYRDMAGVLGINLDTVVERMTTDPVFRAAYERGMASLRVSLRRTQVKKALDGDVRMLQWIGQQPEDRGGLGQSSKVIQQNQELPPVAVTINGDSVEVEL